MPKTDDLRSTDGLLSTDDLFPVKSRLLKNQAMTHMINYGGFMRKVQKNMILELTDTFSEAHKSAKSLLESMKTENTKMLLVDCQKTAVQIMEIIEKYESAACPAIEAFRKYCGVVFDSFQKISSGNNKIDFDELDNKLSDAKKCIEDIKTKSEIVFFPYKASMWDSLESIWKAANDDPEYDAYVVPIPYYDRNSDRSFGKFHYEGNEYPDYVPVTDYRKYDYKTRRPDIVYIHNPYDELNYVTSVHPDYYSSELKKYTDCLVYVPYFVLQEVSPSKKLAAKSVEHFCLSNGVINADKVIVQSEDMRQVYIDILLKQYGNTPANRKMLENKILGLGSPKFDKIAETNIENPDIPDKWKELIYKPDGTKKKVIFYNTAISGLLSYKEKWLKKILQVFEIFRKKTDEAVLLWRPHPLIKSTMDSMLPMFSEIYDEIVENYIAEGWGIYDDTSDMNRAINISDMYYGDNSSVVSLFKAANKPVMLQNAICDNEKPSFAIDCYTFIKNNGRFEILSKDLNALIYCYPDSGKAEIAYRYDADYDLDLYHSVRMLRYKNKIFIFSYQKNSVDVFDCETGMIHSIIYSDFDYSAIIDVIRINSKAYIFLSLSSHMYCIDLEEKSKTVSLDTDNTLTYTRALQRNEHIYMLTRNEGNIKFIDFNANNNSIHMTQLIHLKFSECFYIDKNNLYVLGADHSGKYIFTIYDPGSCKLIFSTTIPNITLEKNKTKYFKCICKNNKLFFIPGISENKILIYDIIKKTFIDASYPENYFDINANFWEARANNDNIYVFPAEGGVTLSINTIDNSVGYVEWTIDDTVYKERINKSFEKLFGKENICKESVNLNLSGMLEFENPAQREKQEFSNIGHSIHKEITGSGKNA